MGSLRLFLDDVRRHGWAPIPLTATDHRGEFAKRPEDLPRFLEEHVITRMERDDALDRLPTITTRTLVHVLIETGLRAVDARTLPLDALSVDGAGAPYLRYFNHKLNRERWLPISPRWPTASAPSRHGCASTSATTRPCYPPSGATPTVAGRSATAP